MPRATSRPRPHGRSRRRGTRRVRPVAVVAVLALTAGACDPAAGRQAGEAPAAGGGNGGGGGSQEARAPLPDSAFAVLVSTLSEPDGYFDTDNLISNEASYLHVVGELEERGVRGGGYVGVGPGQNFSYIATIRPALAFLVDLRRDNLLQHLWFKALFETADTRLDYLCLMVARRCGGASDGLEVGALLARVDAAPPIPSPDSLIDRVLAVAVGFGVPLSAEDERTIRAIHGRFAADGLALRFNSHGRPPRPEYPTLRRLVLERDERGRPASYLASEAAFRTVRELQRANRVVPVVGDLAGAHALRAIGEELRRRELVLSAFYTSNVEFYLFRQGAFPRFIANLEALPSDAGSVVIRSYFNRFRALPQTRPGYASTQLLDTVPALLARWREGRIGSYRALVWGPVDAR